MEKERNLNYWTIRKFSLLYSYYAIIDTTDYAPALWQVHQISEAQPLSAMDEAADVKENSPLHRPCEEGQ